MKKLFLLLAALLPAAASAQVSLGIDLSSHLTHQTTDVPDAKTNDFQFGIRPTLIIQPSDNIEIVPNIGFSFAHWKTETTTHNPVTGDVVTEDDGSTVGVSGGCGLFFRIIDGNPFRLSLGPDIQVGLDDPEGDNNDIFNFTLGMPVNIDLMLSQKLWVRLSDRLVWAGYQNEQLGEDNDHSTVTFFDIHTLMQPSLGFYFTF